MHGHRVCYAHKGTGVGTPTRLLSTEFNHYCVLHVTWQTRNLHIILRAEIQNAISHPFLNGLL